MNELSSESVTIANSIIELNALEQFYNQWESSNDKIDSVWGAFRSLPLQSGYLIASHYFYKELGWVWHLSTKWELYSEFDQLVKTQGISKEVSLFINSAIETQKKIVSLEKAFFILNSENKTTEDRNHIFTVIKEENRELYQEIIHNIWIAKGKPIQGNQEIRSVDEIFNKAVVEEMLHHYKEGLPQLDDYLFKDITSLEKTTSFSSFSE